jgi:hypothetical protein
MTEQADPMVAYANLTPEQKAEHDRQIAEQAARERTTVVPGAAPVEAEETAEAEAPEEDEEAEARRTARSRK